MTKLSSEMRHKLPGKDFALPGKGAGKDGKGSGSYPVENISHARNALARVSQNGSPDEKAKVKAKVKSKFPSIDQSDNDEDDSPLMNMGK